MGKETGKKFSLSGLRGSSVTSVIASLYRLSPFSGVFLLNDREEAAYFYDDLNNLGLAKNILFFPSSFKRSIHHEAIDNENIILRTDVLDKLSKRDEDYLIISHPEAVMEKVISGKGLVRHTLDIRKGEKLSTGFINEVLFEYGFERVDFVYEPGQYSIRGSIIDIFSFSHEDPYRIDFFGDEVDSIRTFDIESQVSKEGQQSISIIPNIREGFDDEERIPLFEYLDRNCVVAAKDLKYVAGNVSAMYDNAMQVNDGNDFETERFIDGDTLLESLKEFSFIEFGTNTHFKDAEEILFNTSKQPLFSKNFDLLGDNLSENNKKGYKNIIVSSSPKQIERLHAIFNDKGDPRDFDSLPFALHEGFIDHDLKFCCYTDHQIFERYHRFNLRSKKSARQAITIKELNKLHPGDYVVHVDHGIGKFAGLVKTEADGKLQEAIRLIYKNNDSLLVSIHSLHRITKYKGKDGAEPKINKLGSAAWQNLKNKTKKKVKDIARELIALYAQRKDEKGNRSLTW